MTLGIVILSYHGLQPVLRKRAGRPLYELFFHLHTFKNRDLPWIRLHAFHIIAREADVDVVIERDNRHFAVDHVFGLLQQAQALVGIGLFGGLGAEVVKLGTLPVAVVLKAVGVVFVGEGGGVRIVAVPGGDADSV